VEIVIFALFVALIGVLAILGARAARRRREAFALLAHRLGLNFSPDRDAEIARRFGFLDKLAQGSNRYAFNILSGTFRNHTVWAFDYHYETHSTDSKGHRHTHHHYFSCLLLMLEREFPELRIGREGFFSKIAQGLGYDDIDFESHEFSRTFCVRSKDKKFAYDFCHALLMQYLLQNQDLSIEVDGAVMAIIFASRLDPAQVEHNLARLVELRSLMPKYLFN
jgi:hypothetical protein